MKTHERLVFENREAWDPNQANPKLFDLGKTSSVQLQVTALYTPYSADRRAFQRQEEMLEPDEIIPPRSADCACVY